VALPFLVLIAAASDAGFGAQDCAAASQALANDLEVLELAKVRGRFAPELARRLSVDVLADFWRGSSEGYGTLKGIRLTRDVSVPDGRAQWVVLDHERGTFFVHLVWNAAMEVVDLRVETSLAWTPPTGAHWSEVDARKWLRPPSGRFEGRALARGQIIAVATHQRWRTLPRLESASIVPLTLGEAGAFAGEPLDLPAVFASAVVRAEQEVQYWEQRASYPESKPQLEAARAELASLKARHASDLKPFLIRAVSFSGQGKDIEVSLKGDQLFTMHGIMSSGTPGTIATPLVVLLFAAPTEVWCRVAVAS
jgi:hypothetical protein